MRALYWLLIGCCALAPVTARAAGLEAVASFGSNPGGLRMWKYVPAGVPPNAPLVLALHGCTQQAADYVHAGWNELADANLFYVVYGEQTSANNAATCFNFYQSANQTRGQGENLSLKQMIDQMKADHSIDASRVFVTGLSAGAAETAVMLAVWPDVFAGGAPIAGVPFACGANLNDAATCTQSGKTLTPDAWGALVRAAAPAGTVAWPRVSIWHGTSDAVVVPSNEVEMVKQWTNVHGIDQTPAVTEMVGGFPHRLFQAGGKTVVESYEITGMAHGTPIDPANGCGTKAPYFIDEKLCSTLEIARFFGLITNTAPLPDAGAADGASGPAHASGCGCRVGASAPRDRTAGATASLLLAAWWLGLARRRRSGVAQAESLEDSVQ